MKPFKVQSSNNRSGRTNQSSLQVHVTRFHVGLKHRLSGPKTAVPKSFGVVAEEDGKGTGR